MIIITALVPASPETRDEIIALCTAHSARSRSEPGCISHNIHIDCEDASRLFYYEQWRDEAAVAAHFARQESIDFVKRIAALVGEQPAINLYRSESITPADIT